MRIHHCDQCGRHVIVTWELWDGSRCCLGCIHRAVRTADLADIEARFRDAMRRERHGGAL